MSKPAGADLADVSGRSAEGDAATGPGAEAEWNDTERGTGRGTSTAEESDVTSLAEATEEGQRDHADDDDSAKALPAPEMDESTGAVTDPTLEGSLSNGRENEASSADDGAQRTERSAPLDGSPGGWTITVPAGGTTAVQDDVVIGSTVVQDSTWLGSQTHDVVDSDLDSKNRLRLDDDLSFPSLTDSKTDVTPNGKDLPLDEPIDSDRSTYQISDDRTDSGMDVDWEPWGGGGLGEPDRRTENPSEANDTSPPIQANTSPHDGGAESTGLERARALLDELQSTFATLSVPQEPEVDPRAIHAMDQIDQVGQLLETWSDPAIDADRLAELKGLASDLEDRDYDIRALQRFSQERGLILELAQLVEQQRDVIRQIRSTLHPSS